MTKGPAVSCVAKTGPDPELGSAPRTPTAVHERWDTKALLWTAGKSRVLLHSLEGPPNLLLLWIARKSHTLPHSSDGPPNLLLLLLWTAGKSRVLLHSSEGPPKLLQHLPEPWRGDGVGAPRSVPAQLPRKLQPFPWVNPGASSSAWTNTGEGTSITAASTNLTSLKIKN